MNHNEVAKRIWQKDATLWKSDPESIKIINNSLGWLTVADEMIGVADDLVEFAESIRTRGFQHVMVCGMGGSSLCPEVLAQTFGRQPGFPELLVLDSTDPDVIAAFQERIDVEHCLFIIASKSGSTTEPNVFYKFWSMSDLVTERTEREDFQATSDPALLESADRGQVNLLSYAQLYNLWERQQWATQDIDFTQDRIDWHERIPEEERFQRMYGLSSFFIGEQKVAEELGPMMRAAPTEEMRIFLCTQIADEARHVRFFNRFYEEVGVLEAGDLQGRLAETSQHVNPEFNELFDDMLKRRVDHLARQPEDLEKLVEAVTLYHMVIEGMLALTGQHFILQYNEEQGTLPGFVEGFNNIARDEHRHVAFGARFLREMAQADSRYGEAIARTLGEVAPIADAVLRPKWYVEGETELFGTDLEETRAFAAKALERRLKVIGLAPVA